MRDDASRCAVMQILHNCMISFLFHCICATWDQSWRSMMHHFFASRLRSLRSPIHCGLKFPFVFVFAAWDASRCVIPKQNLSCRILDYERPVKISSAQRANRWRTKQALLVFQGLATGEPAREDEFAFTRSQDSQIAGDVHSMFSSMSLYVFVWVGRGFHCFCRGSQVMQLKEEIHQV